VNLERSECGRAKNDQRSRGECSAVFSMMISSFGYADHDVFQREQLTDAVRTFACA